MAQTLEAAMEIDFKSHAYLNAYSRINAIVIEGEAEAYTNYLQLGEMLPEYKEDFTKLAKMEERHRRGFISCGKNLNVEPDMEFAKEFFDKLRTNFQKARTEGDVVACLLIQSLIIECFAIAAYNIYIPVADPFARKITEGVVKDEYSHLNFGVVWLNENFETAKAPLEEANRKNLPLIWQMLNQVADDARQLGMEKEDLVEDFMIQYGESLGKIGFIPKEIMRLSVMGLTKAE
jgi:fatty aldehyde decarbonylase